MECAKWPPVRAVSMRLPRSCAKTSIAVRMATKVINQVINYGFVAFGTAMTFFTAEVDEQMPHA